MWIHIHNKPLSLNVQDLSSLYFFQRSAYLYLTLIIIEQYFKFCKILDLDLKQKLKSELVLHIMN